MKTPSIVIPTVQNSSGGWITEFMNPSISGDVRILVKCKNSNISSTLPKELYLTHIYRFTLKCTGSLCNMENLVAELTLINSVTKEEVIKDGKPAIDGTTSVSLVNGEGGMKIKFCDTSYHHGKRDFILRAVIYCVMDNSYCPLIQKVSNPFKVYSKRKRTFASTRTVRPNPLSSFAQMICQYFENPISLGEEERRIVRETMFDKTPINERHHFKELMEKFGNLEENSKRFKENSKEMVSNSKLLTPLLPLSKRIVPNQQVSYPPACPIKSVSSPQENQMNAFKSMKMEKKESPEKKFCILNLGHESRGE